MARRKTQNNIKKVNNASNNQDKNVTHEYNSYYSNVVYHNSYGSYNLYDYYTPDTLRSIVKDPMANNETLRDVSWRLFAMDGTYANTVLYMDSLPTLSHVVVTHGKSKTKKKKNKEAMENTLRAIKDKEIIRDIMFKGMVDGISFGYFETNQRNLSNAKGMNDYDVRSIVEINNTEYNISIISLNPKYTKIIGIKNGTYVIAFDLNYFVNSDGEPLQNKLRKYPKEIRDAWNNRNRDMPGWNWVVLDYNRTIVFKINSARSEPWGRPLCLQAISDILYSQKFVDTKRNVLDKINNKIVYQTLPEGAQKGVCSLTKKQQEDQHNVVKRAVQNKSNDSGVSFFTVASGTKIDSLSISDTEGDLFDDSTESNLNNKIALDFGIAGSLLNGVGSGSYSSQTTNLELLSSQIFQWIEQIEAELNKVINANIIKDRVNWVEVSYLKITNVNKSEMVKYAKELYLSGNGSLSYWIASCGISPDVYYAMLDSEYDEGVYTKYLPHQTSYTLSSDDVKKQEGQNQGGRPETDTPSDNTVISRSYNGNDMPSPSDNK